MEDLFLVMVDRDGDDSGHDAAAAQLNRNHPDKLIACLAHQEVEVWMIALHRGRLDAGWSTVRAERDPKERFVQPYLDKMGWSGLVGRGYKRAMHDLAGQWRGLLSVCPEIADLSGKIQRWIEEHG